MGKKEEQGILDEEIQEIDYDEIPEEFYLSEDDPEKEKGCIMSLFSCVFFLAVLVIIIVVSYKSVVCTLQSYSKTYIHEFATDDVNALVFNASVINVKFVEWSEDKIQITQVHKNSQNITSEIKKPSSIPHVVNPINIAITDKRVTYELEQTVNELLLGCHVVLFTVKYPKGKIWNSIQIEAESGWEDLGQKPIYFPNEIQIGYLYLKLATNAAYFKNLTVHIVDSPISTVQIDRLSFHPYLGSAALNGTFQSQTGYIIIKHLSPHTSTSSEVPISITTTTGPVEVGFPTETCAKVEATQSYGGIYALSSRFKKTGSNCDVECTPTSTKKYTLQITKRIFDIDLVDKGADADFS
eukprot:TRINITY_DN2530_c0_g1_i1.p1 TRINITY_DN2530_c0_g1~~TRINITY_DN2530_c0_g1_i1.p1  ORF type:complete len:354 (+),score=74.31 TRINITY_DN2530_c0_g1_i1:44-1105(+)